MTDERTAVGRPYDVVVVGGGIVGLATARALLSTRPELRLLVVEKETRLATHQTGRNSGVLHSGIYYRPGTLKARLGVEGRVAMVRFCEEFGIPHETCGKVIVALDDSELARVDTLLEHAIANGVRAERIGVERLHELEPYTAGIGGILVHDTGIVDFVSVAHAMAEQVEAWGAELRLGTAVLDVIESSERVVVETTTGSIETRTLVNCAGLQCDEVARRVLGPRPDVRIVPFRGEYHELVPERRHLVRNLVYPVPDPELPFLGVHLTRDVHGGVHVGPNAVLALSREGYRWGAIEWREVVRLARYPGFRKMARRFWKVGIHEVRRSVRKRSMVAALRRLIPDIGVDDLVSAPAGVRAQAVARDGRLLDDFELRETDRAVHVLNAPSPAATASLVIGREIATRVLTRL